MPDVVATLEAWRALAERERRASRRLGLVLTMGALHDGHRALLERARTERDVVLATIFVNPLQFGDAEDLDRYPRDLDADLALCAEAGVDHVLAPDVGEVWPSWPAATATSVHVAGLTEVLEGVGRPGHFDGMAAVVTKLLVVTGPCTAYFGEKDFQQLCVVRRLAEDLTLGVDVVGCPIAREPDGLARSSRNVRLSPEARVAALALPRALHAGAAALHEHGDVAACEAAMVAVASGEPAVDLAYAAAVEPTTLRAPTTPVAPGTVLRLLVAGVVDGVRLIDNVEAVVGPTP